MKYFWLTLGWIWSQRKFLVVSVVAALVFFAWLFPFGDLSDLVTSTIARGTNNQIYMTFESMDLNLVPTPAVSAKNVSVETSFFPALEAKWMKIAPSWMTLMWNAWTIKRASGGDSEAVGKLSTRLGVSVEAEGLLGGDVELRIRPGSTTDQGSERSKVSLVVDKLNLAELQKWGDLPVKLQGQGSLDATVQATPGFTEQPEGEIDLQLNHFNMPAATLMIPFEGAMMPVNLPTLTLANVVLRGHLNAGKFIIDEGVFGKSPDPVYGRIKGSIFVKLQSVGSQLVPLFGAYSFNVDLYSTRAVEKEIGFAFLLFDSAKTPTATGSHYLFLASGQGLGPPPAISRINSF